LYALALIGTVVVGAGVRNSATVAAEFLRITAAQVGPHWTLRRGEIRVSDTAQ